MYNRKPVYRKKAAYAYKPKKAVYKKYKPSIPRSVGKPSEQIFSFKRKFEVAPITVASGAAISQVYSPSLGNIPSPTDFTNLFDMYKITGLTISLTPNTDMNSMGQPFINQRFNLFSVIDYNDLNTITVAQAEQYQNCKRTISTKTHSRYFVPRIALTQTDVSATSFVASYESPWISTSNTNVAHGFLKVISDINPNAGSAYFTVNVTMYMKFKNVN